MLRLRRVGAAILVSWVAWVGPVRLGAQNVPVQATNLPNGMRVLLVERRDEPTIAVGWVAHVGSANERPGITGLAHLFEHMMFKGTRTIGTSNYAQDLRLIAQQEKVRAAMRTEERKLRAALLRGEIDDLLKPENRTPRLRELDAQFQRLLAQQRAILVKNEFDRIYTEAGASGLNAFTSEDMTAYFVTVPANKLELWCWMESERMLRPVFREFYAERDVVMEERRLRTEATPLGRFEEEFEAMVWQSSPYAWPVIGWPWDLLAITKAQAEEFFALHYSPQNITLIVVGDFQTRAALRLIAKYFDRIPRGKADPPEVVTLEIKQQAAKRMYAEAEANPQVWLAWHTVPFAHRDSYALNLLAQILSTRTGRLFKGLVLGRQLATEASADTDHRKLAGLFVIRAEAKQGHGPEQVEQAIYEELDRLKQEEVPAEELQKVKNNFAAAEYRRLTSNMSILFQLIYNDGLGDWREINAAGPKHQAVTAADIKRVANQYLTKENSNVAIITRKAGRPAESNTKS